MLAERVRAKEFALAVVGVGRVGLPVAVKFASVGVAKVTGIDSNLDLVATLNQGRVPFEEEGLGSLLTKVRKRGNISFTHQYDSISGADVIVICVGTPLTQDFRPQIGLLISCFIETLRNLDRKRDVLVIIRSTVPPGTTRSMLQPMAKEYSTTNISLAVCPERIVEGHALEELEHLPEIVGTDDPPARESARAFFQLLNAKKLINFTDPTSAELAKLFCNIYRYSTFALANEFAMIAENLKADGNEAIRVANEGYSRAGIPRAGPSGGPCLYKDGYFINDVIAHVGMVRKSWQVNEYVPLHIVKTIEKIVGPLFKAKVGVLGMTYKRGSDDTRYSPAMRIIEILKDQGAEVSAHDPHVPNSAPIDSVLKSDVVVVAVNHPEFEKLDLNKMTQASLVYDVCGTLSGIKARLDGRGIRYTNYGSYSGAQS
ncbi:MAG: nucleotide sugar dehydrogenase [Nitrososphaerota archaeon]|nr:nucleotide sugar dehydrogenase [Nitrososphaerota archaeon]MDG7024400.1 nucleotide sugar dehydrogenase [Nitrososphaerota archaeon]